MINKRLSALRRQMEINKVDAYLVTSADSHQSEYPADHFTCREYISGFTGSAGTIVITKDFAGLWTDGRYYIQAANQIAGSEFTLFKAGLQGVIKFEDWLSENLSPGSTLGFDGRTVSIDLSARLKKKLKSALFKSNLDLVGQIWEDRPPLPLDAAFLHHPKFAGKSHADKLRDVRCEMKKLEVKAYIISSLTDIAWLYNIRGSDVLFTPVVYAYAYISETEDILFINKEKLNEEIILSFDSKVTIKDYNDIIPFIKALKLDGSILLNKETTSTLFLDSLPQNISYCHKGDITENLKGRKSADEIRNIMNCQVRDGVAMVKFIKHLKETVADHEVHEHEIHDMLLEFRSKQEHFVDASFSTIAAYMENAAQMHYDPEKGRDAVIKPEGFLLIDSGGQYFDGTTDITRTLVMGALTPEMKKDFTLTLKSHIGLATAKWLYGATGANLDILARKPMWDNAMDYKCGTGHGLGYLLSVHEGPQRINQSSTVVLEEGMLTTNEPGVYKEGQWGIRTENTCLVEKDIETRDGQFMKFKTVSYCPIDLAGIDFDMLSASELEWLNQYHQMVYDKLSPFLDEDEKKWLELNTILEGYYE